MYNPRALFLVNYPPGYVLSSRARSFAGALGDEYIINFQYRGDSKLDTYLKFWRAVIKFRPNIIYTMEGSAAESTAFLSRIFFRIPYIVDRANAAEDHFRESNANFFFVKIIALLEKMLLGVADGVVCRGRNQTLVFRARYYNRNIVHCSEGTDLEKWIPKKSPELRKRYGLNGKLTIGTIGTATWGVLGHYFARETVEVLRMLKELNIVGVILPSLTSNENALMALEKLAEEYGVSDKLLIIRGVAREDVPEYLDLIDVCLSTQLRTLSGEMRTTAKLPDYLACGKFILSTDIGDAGFYLPKNMLITHDEQYYIELSRRISELYFDRNILTAGIFGVEIAREYFDYSKIADKAAELIKKILNSTKKG